MDIIKTYLAAVVRRGIIFMLLPAMSGCIYEYPDPNCFANKDVRVVYDWSLDPTSTPEGMSVLFYPVDGDNYWRYELGRDGGNVSLKKGTYNIVSFNNDTGSILFENQDSYHSALITTRPARLTDGLSISFSGPQPPRDLKEESQPVVAQPDVVWGVSESMFVSEDSGNPLVLTPSPMVSRYRVVIDEVENIESSSQVSMALSGLSAGRVLSNGKLIDVAVTVPSSLRRTAENTLGGWLIGFGRNNDAGLCMLSVYALLRDGSRKVYRFDVSSIVAEAPDPHDVEIRIKGLSFPKVDISEGAGMEIGVDDWDEVEINIST